jgi:MYXO-CTERM domain-containing protein
MRVLAFVLSLFPLAASAAPHTVLYRHPSDERPAFVAGDLSGPTTLAPEAAARALLRAAPDLAPVDLSLLGTATVRRLQRGTVVRFELQHAGIPVADATVVVRLDDQGRARMVLGAPVRIDPTASARPALDLDAARQVLAATHAAHRAGLVEQAVARLVWVVKPDRMLRLAWEFRLAPTPLLAESLLYRVDAQSGALVTARNLVRFADQANVYQTNPVTSTLQVVTLAGRAPNGDQPADALSNPYVNVVNCKDNHHTTPMTFGGSSYNIHTCDEISTVVRDGNGDYLQYQPVVPDTWGPDPATAPADEDPFSEVQMYHHVMTAYSYFQAFANPDFAELDAKPIQATVNYRLPIDFSGGFDFTNITNPNGILYPLVNAMFMPPGQLIPGITRPASIVFGQGNRADFSYDGDVVFHEFTHGVVWSTSNLVGPGIDEQGLDPAPNAMNEGFADIFSSFIAGDPHLGEYTGAEIGGVIRDLTIKYRCPDLLWGEAHQDGMALSWAVWAAREQLGQASEAPIFAAMASLPSDASFGEATAAMEQELTDHIGASAAAAAHALFVEANLIDCKRVIDYTGPREILFTEGTSIGLNPAPGYLQFKYPIAGRAQSLHVEFTFASMSEMSIFGNTTPGYSVYVRKGTPITWNASVAATTDYEFPLVLQDDQATFKGDLAQILEPGDYYVEIVSTGSTGGELKNVAITHVGAPQDDAGLAEDDAGTGTDAGTGGDASGSGISRDKGCGCRTTAPASGASAALLLVALLLVRRRR